MATDFQSNAFNFLTFLQHQVDPRTGQYTVNITFPDIKANFLCGPTLPLTMQFNPLNKIDIGFGPGWDWRISQFDTTRQLLSLSTGETFKVTQWNNANALFSEKKLDTFHFYRESEDTYRIAHKSGLSEILMVQGAVARPQRLYSPQGHEIRLDYILWNGHFVLNSVVDAQDLPLLKIEGIGSGTVTVQLYPNSGAGGEPLSVFKWSYIASLLETVVTLPTDDDATWKFKYKNVRDFYCVTDVWTPSGAHETVAYDDAGHGHPAGNQRLPRVTAHVIDPGANQSITTLRYEYILKGQANQHNFLGYQAPGLVWKDDGLDNLYQVLSDYTYGSRQVLVVDNIDTQIIQRTYNRFHLLVQEDSEQANKICQIKTTYHVIDDFPFDRQPAIFQLPKEVKTTWYHSDNPSHLRQEIETSSFDINGNVTHRVLPDKTSEVSTYYPADGEGTWGDEFYCPRDLEGFVRSLKTKRLYPAASTYGQAPTLQLNYSYASLPAVVPGLADTLVLTKENLMQVITSKDKNGAVLAEVLEPLQTIERTYYDTPQTPLTHGRLQRQTTSIGSVSRFVDFDYQLALTPTNEPVLQTQQTLTTTLDATTGQSLVQSSLINGLSLLERDAVGVETAYTYDVLGRLLSQTAAPNTPEQATRSYQYNLAVAPGINAEQIVTDALGVKTRSLLDGLNRVVSQERQDSDNPLRANEYRLTYAADYDSLGNLVEETHYDWLDATRSLSLTTLYHYDDWNKLRCTTGPDNVEYHEEHDPIGLSNTSGIKEPMTTQWRQLEGALGARHDLSVTRFNAFNKPLQIERFDLQEKLISVYQYRYDGASNCVQEIDELKRTTHYVYDVWSRMITNTLPDQSHVHLTYAAHSSAALTTRLEVEFANTRKVSVGSQLFDGLERVTQLQVGPRVDKFFYQGAQAQVYQRQTPSNRTIDYTYNLNLTNAPISTTAEVLSTFEHDTTSALLIRSETPDGSRHYEYNKAQQLIQETWTDKSGKVVEQHYASTLMGRQLSRKDIIEGKETLTSYEYDDKGRVLSIDQGHLHAQFEYDPLGRLKLITSKDASANNTLITEFEYDYQNRETKRSFKLNSEPLKTLTQTWNVSGLLATRHLQQSGKRLLEEQFSYDARGRLEVHECTGESLPNDRYGNAIAMQVFVFDALDNITERHTFFSDNTLDIAVYSYPPEDPCQLLSVSHSHPSYVSQGQALVTFNYDLDGNQLNDELGQTLAYDSQSRLLSVSDITSAVVSSYRYDAHDQLVASRHNTESEMLRLYEGNQLAGTLQDQIHTRFLYGIGQPIGQQQSDDSSQTMLLMCDANASVIAQSQQTEILTTAYSAYGETDDAALRSLLAFNGEAREQGSGWYLLGKGYRAYNPSLMRFHSPDSFSPFGAGGVNPYAYCLGNPIALHDPTGHESYSRRMDPTNPLFFNAEQAAGLTAVDGLITAAMIGVGVALSVVTGGTAMVIAVGLAIDLVATSMYTYSLYTRGDVKKNLEIGSYLVGAIQPWGGKKPVVNMLDSNWILKKSPTGIINKSTNLPLSPSSLNKTLWRDALWLPSFEDLAGAGAGSTKVLHTAKEAAKTSTKKSTSITHLLTTTTENTQTITTGATKYVTSPINTVESTTSLVRAPSVPAKGYSGKRWPDPTPLGDVALTGGWRRF